MVLELDRLNSYYLEQRELITKMRGDLDFWLETNGLSRNFKVSKLNSKSVVLESTDMALTDVLLKDFELVFGVTCVRICECKIDNLVSNNTFAKCSYYFTQSGGIF